MTVPVTVSSWQASGTNATVMAGQWNGQYPYNITGNQGGVQWTLNLYSASYCYFGILGPDGLLYVAGGHYGIQAIEPGGSVRWYYNAYDCVSEPVVSDNGTVFFATGSPRYDSEYEHSGLYAVKDGRLIWLLPLTGDGCDGGLVRSNEGTIYLTTNYHFDNRSTLWAVDSDGSIKWKHVFTSQSSGRPALCPDGSVIVFTTSITKFSKNGTIEWEVPSAVGGAKGPLVGGDGTIYCVGGNKSLVTAYHPNGSEAWHYGEAVENAWGDPALTSDTLYFFSGDAIIALWLNATERWVYQLTDYEFVSSLAISADGMLVFLSVGNETTAVALNTDGAVLWECMLANQWVYGVGPRPVIAEDGTVYFFLQSSIIGVNKAPLITPFVIEAVVGLALLSSLLIAWKWSWIRRHGR